MLSDDLYTKGIPGLGEAIPAEDYAAMTGQSLEQVVDDINAGQVLGVLHRDVWYVEAPPFCEENLRALHSRKRDESRARNEEQERRRRENGRRQHQAQHDSADTDLDRKYGKILGLTGRVTWEDVKRRWRELSKQYHPDNVQHLGPKLREVAEKEMKAINEAYQHFRERYGI